MTTLAMGTLRQEQMGNAAGIFNLMRNLGGSVGIAVVTTLLSRGSQSHQAYMAGHLSVSNTVFVQQHAMLAKSLTPELGKQVAQVAANGVLYGQMQQQSMLWAYVDNFRMLAVLCVFCLPCVLLFKRTKRAKGPIAMH
jgi:DHA2 family multidrug resistance protein